MQRGSRNHPQPNSRQMFLMSYCNHWPKTRGWIDLCLITASREEEQTARQLDAAKKRHMESAEAHGVSCIWFLHWSRNDLASSFVVAGDAQGAGQAANKEPTIGTGGREGCTKVFVALKWLSMAIRCYKHS